MFWAFRRRFSYKLRSKGSKFVCMNGSSFVEISLKHFQSQTLRAWELKCVTCHMSRITCHMSHVTCHMSHVTCHMSHVTCQKSRIFFFFPFFKMVGACQWSICYQQSRPRLVFVYVYVLAMPVFPDCTAPCPLQSLVTK